MHSANKVLYDWILSKTHPIWNGKFGFYAIHLSEYISILLFARDGRVSMQLHNKAGKKKIALHIHSFDARDAYESIRLHFGNSLVFSGELEKAVAKRNEINLLNFRGHEENPSESHALTEFMGHIAESSMNLLLLSLKDLIQQNGLHISLSDFGYVVF